MRGPVMKKRDVCSSRTKKRTSKGGRSQEGLRVWVWVPSWGFQSKKYERLGVFARCFTFFSLLSVLFFATISFSISIAKLQGPVSTPTVPGPAAPPGPDPWSSLVIACIIFVLHLTKR